MRRLAIAALLIIGGLLCIAALRLHRDADPYLAAERFLREQGLQVTRAQDLGPLSRVPPVDLSVMLLGDREYMSPSQAQTLLAWVYAGGRLLVTVQGYWAAGRGAADPLLDPLNIRLLDAYASGGGALVSARTTLTALFLESEQAPLLMGFAPGRHLEDADDLAQSWANSPQGTHMLQLNLGAGTLTVVSDTALWRNHAIGQFDNAWLLWYLNQGRHVVMQYREATSRAGFLQQLAAHPATLAGTMLLCVLLAWATTAHWARFKPERRSRATRGRRMRAGQPTEQALLRSLHADILWRAGQRYPGFAHWPVAEQWQLLARLAATSTARIAEVMRPPAEKASAGLPFEQQVARLQIIRKAL